MLISSAVLLLLVMALTQVLMKEMNFVVGSAKRSIVLHAADAGIDRAMYALQVGGNWDAIPKGLVSGYNFDVTYTDIPDVAYSIRVQEGNWTPGVQMGDYKRERTVTVLVRNTNTGEKKKVQAVVMLSSLDSALYSEGQTFITGSADVHWGPIVSYSTKSDSIPNPQNWTDHPIFLSKGGILLNNKGSASSQGLNCPDPVVGKCVCEYCLAVGDPPTIPIDTFRNIARKQDIDDARHYYGPFDNAGNTFVCGPFIQPPLPATMDEYSVVFFDSGDGKNFDPFTDTICNGSYTGANDRGAKIQYTDLCGKGNLIVMGNLFLSGNGSCPTITMMPPSDCAKLEANVGNCVPKASSGLFWDGFVFVAGEFSSQGTQQLYGSVFSYKFTADITGNFSLYYKSENQSMGYLGKSLLIKVWLERAPRPGDIFP